MFILFQVVAVKQLDRNGVQGNKEFLEEVLTLSLLHHDNLVNLIGYCADGDQRLLVYEFVKGGSLERHLLGTHQFITFFSILSSLIFWVWVAMINKHTYIIGWCRE